MAQNVTTVNTTSYKSTATHDNTKTSVTITTDTDNKRVTYIRIAVTPGAQDSNTYTEQAKKNVHNAIVTAIEDKIGNGI